MPSVTLDEFLKPISAALGHTSVPEAVEPCAATHAPVAGELVGLSNEQLVAKFVDEGTKMGTVVVESSEADVAKAVLNLIDQFGGNGEVVYADVPEIDAYGIPEALASAKHDARRWDPSSREASVGFAEHADIGITVATAGIAETATILQRMSQQSGRAICLLPIGHIAILKKSAIYPYMTQLMDAWEDNFAETKEMPSSFVFISGPSNTADIELVRVVGVHGPVHAGVILVD